MLWLLKSYRSRKQLGFLVYSGADEHSAPVRFSGMPHAELCSTAQIDHNWLHTKLINYLSVLFFFAFLFEIFFLAAYPQCILSVLVEAQSVSI